MWLRHVNLSKAAVGTFFREAHPGSEMASQNDHNYMFAKNDQNDPKGSVTERREKLKRKGPGLSARKIAIYGAI